jgi:hypothetical protein
MVIGVLMWLPGLGNVVVLGVLAAAAVPQWTLIIVGVANLLQLTVATLAIIGAWRLIRNRPGGRSILTGLSWLFFVGPLMSAPCWLVFVFGIFNEDPLRGEIPSWTTLTMFLTLTIATVVFSIPAYLSLRLLRSGEFGQAIEGR